MHRLEAINERWVRWVRNIPVLRVMGATECAYGIAIALRPGNGPAGEFAHLTGMAGWWLAVAFGVCGIPALFRRLHVDYFWLLAWPFLIYLICAWVWARTEGGTYTAIAANFSVVAVLAYEAARVAYGNHDGE